MIIQELRTSPRTPRIRSSSMRRPTSTAVCPMIYTSGGPGSGIYQLERRRGDLGAADEGPARRASWAASGSAAARSKPGVVYALIEHEDGGIWRSEDYGDTWKRTCDAPTFRRVNSRPFYYSQIHVDPSDDRTVYVLSTGLFVSNDGGQKFRPIGAGIHPDHHGFWIDPSNPAHLIDGNDGGIDISYDGGKTWQAGPEHRRRRGLPGGLRHGHSLSRLLRPPG